jgi:hypothetical protein
MRRTSIWLTSAFVAGLLAVGVPYWQVPYSKVSLPDTLIHPGLLVVVVAAAIARAIGKQRFVPTLLVASAGVPCAVMARVVLDTSQDPTSHNLWPFELIIAVGVGLLASGSGTLLGSIPALISRVSSPR